MAKAKNQSVIVTVTDDALSEIQSVAHKLRSRGMDVGAVHPITGVISGSVAADKMHQLSEIDGVHSVEADAPVGLPENESEAQ